MADAVRQAFQELVVLAVVVGIVPVGPGAELRGIRLDLVAVAQHLGLDAEVDARGVPPRTAAAAKCGLSSRTA